MYRSSIARPTDTSVYPSSDISRCHLQDSRPGWIRCLLSLRGLSSPTTCRFIPAHSGLSVIHPSRGLTAYPLYKRLKFNAVYTPSPVAFCPLSLLQHLLYLLVEAIEEPYAVSIH